MCMQVMREQQSKQETAAPSARYAYAASIRIIRTKFRKHLHALGCSTTSLLDNISIRP